MTWGRTFGVLCGIGAVLALAACSSPGTGDPVVRVPGDVPTLQAAADAVQPGGVIEIAAGTYDEQLLIDTPDVTVRGVDRNRTIIDGGGIRPYGVVATADGVTIENLTVTGATFYGVLVTGLHDENGPAAHGAGGYERLDPDKFPPVERFLIDHVTAYNNGLYGIYAFDAHDGVIRDSYASGSADSGFYVGQCENCGILVEGNVAERNAVGFENANASDSVVIAGNRFSGNRVGMTLLSNYQEAFTPQRSNTVVGNLISSNDSADSPSQADGGFATGIGVSGGRDNTITDNRIEGNGRAGIILANTEDLPAVGNQFLRNLFGDNGVDIANTSATRAPASDNCADGAPTTTPLELAAQLAAACITPGAGADAAATAALEGPVVPDGISFLKVPAPRDQPDLPDVGNARKKLPATVTMPSPGDFTVPTADFLADRSGTR